MDIKGKFSKKIESLKTKIYSKNSNLHTKDRSDIHARSHDVADHWKDDEVKEIVKKNKPNLLKSTMFRKLFFGAIGFFLLAVLFGVFMFFGGSNTVSADNIDITVLGNAFANGGEELPLQIQISNRNNVSLEFADLIVEYQQGAGLGEDIKRERLGIGDISAGSIKKELFNITLFGQQGSTRDIKITLEYRVKGSNAIFVKEKVYTVNISSAPINLLVTGPGTSGSNQNLEFEIKTSLNTGESAENMMIVVEYPRGFDFKSADPEPSFGDNIWLLGDITSGTEKTIKVNGTIVAQSGEQRAFNVYAGQQNPEDERNIGVQFNSQSYLVSVQKPFLETKFTVNGKSESEVSIVSGAQVRGSINWKNTLSSRLTDVEITAELSGDIVNFSTVGTDGFFESSTNKIIWNKQLNPDLAEIEPGESGDLEFEFGTLSGSSTNSEATINLSIRGRQSSLGNAFEDIKNYDRKIIKVVTDLQVAAKVLYRSGSFLNNGPLPPTPDEPTTYTVVWSVANSSNKVVGAEIRATLPVYVKWLNNFQPKNQSVIYNESTREIVWNIGTINEGTGTTGPSKELEFQVEFTPSTSQINQTVPLVTGLRLKGKDAFTNFDINKTIATITHRLNLDLNYNPLNDKVQ
jgi:hypothetical protein